MTTSIDLDAAREALVEERDKLRHHLEEMGATETGELRPDLEFGDGFADAGAATAERTELIGLVDSLKQQLDQVKAALGKLDEGTYGLCDNCGNPISEVRLEARPASSLCVNCKSRR